MRGYLIGKPQPIEAYVALTSETQPHGTALAVEQVGAPHGQRIVP